MSLSPRESDVLSTIVEEYIATACPVGSRTVARKCPLRLSAATMRNTMADLKEKGFLEQPHTSAGALPTPLAFRFYVDALLTFRPPDEHDQRLIEAQLGDAGDAINDVLRRASKLVSSLSSSLAVVAAPAGDNVRLRRVEFVLIAPRRVMAVLVLQGGVIHERLVTVDDDMDSWELVRYSNYLNELLANLTMREALGKILKELKDASHGLSSLTRRALSLAQELMESDPSPEIFIDGASRIFQQPEFSDVQAMRHLLSFLEERSRLLDLLSEAMSQKGVHVTLGMESEMAKLDFGLITSSYRISGLPAGLIAVFGPLRMDYAKVVPVVDYTARVVTGLLMQRL
ncbi:MAG: heat-inducible transcriptional repressor [Desulfovibrionales bacterium]|nr:heat-inducible transcriptional repressor [Desulfovibrionales bacterium]